MAAIICLVGIDSDSKSFAVFSEIPIGWVNVYFNTLPQMDDSYRIVNYDSLLRPDEVSIKLLNGPSIYDYGYSSGSDRINLSVKMVNGKINITCPDVWMYYHADSAKLSLHVTQTQ